jgi:hypothetical protein
MGMLKKIFISIIITIVSGCAAYQSKTVNNVTTAITDQGYTLSRPCYAANTNISLSLQLFRDMSNLGFDISIENILFGNASFENERNSKLFFLVQKYR